MKLMLYLCNRGWDMRLDQHLEKLINFQRLAGYTSVREASFAIGISQAGLAKNISALEDVLQVQLFHRSREGIKLTKEGKEVLRSAEKILKESSLLETRLRSLKTSSSPERLKIGMYDSVAVYFFSELETYLGTLYPEVDIELTVDTSNALATKIQGGNLDLVIGVNLDRFESDRLQFVKLFDDFYSFYVSSRSDLAADALRLLVHGAATDRDGKTMEDHLKLQLKQRGAHWVYNFETLKTLAAQGFGIGVLPTQVAKPLVKKGSLLSFEVPKKSHLFGIHNIGILVQRSFYDSHKEFAEDIYRLGDHWSKS